eukprot:SAG22_NODE_453_length_10316_cov_27.583341_1_plen_123_part_10
MPPSYASAAATVGAVGAVDVSLAAEGLYGKQPQLKHGVACPPAIGDRDCESFAVLGSDCIWHNASAAIGAAAGKLVLVPNIWPGACGPGLHVCIQPRMAHSPVLSPLTKRIVPCLSVCLPAYL